MWNIWLAKNDRIFNDNILLVHAIILNIDRMVLSWFSALVAGPKEKLEASMATIHRSLEKLGPRVEESSEVPTSKEAHDLGTC